MRFTRSLPVADAGPARKIPNPITPCFSFIKIKKINPKDRQRTSKNNRYLIAMKLLNLIAALLFMACANAPTMKDNVLFDFTPSTPVESWSVEDDTVMGGVSQGRLEITEAGHARFYGHVSLENDGGFSSVQHQLESPVDVSEAAAFLVRLKGDGKRYTLRIQSKPDQRYFYQADFPTSGEWETVRVPFQDMSATHHGEPVDVPNFDGGPVHKIQFLIGNKEEQDFEVLIDWLGVED